MSSLRSLSDIPIKYRPIFAPIKQFNHVQTQAFDDAVNTKKHMVIGAPTGSGKTKIFELAIVELLLDLERKGRDVKDVKIIYIAPTKALCNEMHKMWHEKFKPFDVNVALVTGDSDPKEMFDLSDLSPYQIAVTTPEKWDSMTRRWKDHIEVANAVRLVLIDEVHLVGDAMRGPTLEAIVSRMKGFVLHGCTEQIRLILVSASLPNIEDFAKWIDDGQSTVRTIQIAEDKRPVALTRYVLGYNSFGNSFQFNNKLTCELANVVGKLLKELPDKQILIFCSIRNDTETTAQHLVKAIEIPGKQTVLLLDASKRIADQKLQEFVKCGYGFHHAGLSFEDREHIENMYRDGLIRVLVSSQTLAMGVNLPAHTVIIKSTEQFINGSTREIPQSMILQMIGRAGRQQYNNSGRVYIMTNDNKVNYYRNLAVGTVAIASHFSNKLAELLNAEIALNTINDCDATVMQWIRTTFLYARTTTMMSRHDADAKLKDLCQQAIQQLRSSELITIGTDGDLSILPFGTILAKYFLSIETMKVFREFRGVENMEGILKKIVDCKEFNEFYLRRAEKKILNDINKITRIRFSVPGKIDTVPLKVYSLLQAALSHVPIDNTSLAMEAQKMIRTAERFANSLIEFFQADQFPGNSFEAVFSSVILAKSLRTQTWCDLPSFGQLNISEIDTRKLIGNGIGTIEALINASPRDIEDFLGKLIPFGSELIAEAAKKFPCYDVNVEVIQSNHTIVVRITQKNIKYERTMDSNLTVLVGDKCNRLILCEDISEQLFDEFGFYEKCLSYTPKVTFGVVHLIHHSLVGVDKRVHFFTDDILKNKPQTSIKDINEPKKNDNVPQKIDNVPEKINNIPKKVHSILKKNDEVKKKATPQNKTKSCENDQKTLSQFFFKSDIKSKFKFNTPVKSAFQPKSIEINKTIHHSPDLFPTQIDATPKPPDKLYEFANDTDSSASFSSHEAANFALETHTTHDSPLLQVTQIQQKIEQQRNAQQSTSGFVSANKIFKVGSHKDESKQPNQLQDLHEIEKGCKDVDDVCELDDDFMNMIYDEVRGLANANVHLNKASNNITAKILNQNKNANLLSNEMNHGTERIERDFDDCDVNEQESQHPQENVEFWNEFFGTEITDDELVEYIVAENDEKLMEAAKSSVSEPLKQLQWGHRGVLTSQNSVFDVQQPKVTLPQKAPEMRLSNMDSRNQVPLLSVQAASGSMEDYESEPLSKIRKLSPEKVTIHDYAYKPKPQMQPNVLRDNDIQRKRRFMEIDPSNDQTEERKQKKSLMELLADNERSKNEDDEHLKRLNFQIRPNVKPPQHVNSVSLKNVFTRIACDKNESEAYADELVKQCQERLKTDPKYKKDDYDLDYVRYKILRILPENRDTKPNDTPFMTEDELDYSFNFTTPTSRSSLFNR